jgi:hypothetical protein
VIRTGVVAHTTRSTQAHVLASTVKADFISVDDGTLGCNANHALVQETLSVMPSTWSLILEDDAVPVDCFLTQLGEALIVAPSPIVSLYLGRLRPPHYQKRIGAAIAEAHHEEAHWIVSTHLFHAVGYAIKTSLLPSLLKHASDRPSDEHITDWAQRYGHTVAYTVPSLVDHADQPTVVNHPDGDARRPGRRAWSVGSRQRWASTCVPLR